MRAGVPHEDPMLDGGLRGRCARWGVMMRVDLRVAVAWLMIGRPLHHTLRSTFPA